MVSKLFVEYPIILRGAGDLATGVAYRLYKAGFPIMAFELPRPLVVRRRVALASAVADGEVQIEGMTGRRVASFAEAFEGAFAGYIPILVAPELPNGFSEMVELYLPDIEGNVPNQNTVGIKILPGRIAPILIDARMAKRNIDSRIDQAGLVIGLGPGFTAGVDCHAVIETMRGHRLGRVIWDGSAIPDTGSPGKIADKGAERVLRSPVDGVVSWQKEIGDRVQSGEIIGTVADRAILAPFDGFIRGLILPGIQVPSGLKIGDIDARSDLSACFTISDKSLAIGGGVLEAILTWIKGLGMDSE
jgi:xanthine dehydrogenase accessory factor